MKGSEHPWPFTLRPSLSGTGHLLERMTPGIKYTLQRGLLLCLGLALVSTVVGQRAEKETELTDLEDFIIYAEPEVMDALRKRPYSRKDPVVEAFFHSLPGINNEIYRANLKKMSLYLKRCKTDMRSKLKRISELAGLDEVPTGLIEGYEERIDFLETLLEWMEDRKPVTLKRINIWKDSDLRYRLARVPLENIRLNPDTDELESRLLIDWNLMFQKRPKARDVQLTFDMGIQLQSQNGYYNPVGFLHIGELRRRDLNPVEVTYPVIITDALRDKLDAELPNYLAAYRTTINSFYQILQEYFFSDLADIHALYILTRGEIFADEWGQYQSTALQRGLAAYIVFQAFEESLGKPAIRELQKNDWTTWHIRKIGAEFNPIVWEGEEAPAFGYGEYKESLNMRNIYWSTLLVQSLADQYGPQFVSDMCEAIKNSRKRSPLLDYEIFKRVTGNELELALKDFVTSRSN